MDLDGVSYVRSTRRLFVEALSFESSRKDLRAFAAYPFMTETESNLELNTHLSEAYATLASARKFPLSMAIKAVKCTQTVAAAISDLEADAHANADKKMVIWCQEFLTLLRDTTVAQIDSATAHTFLHADEFRQEDEIRKGEIYATATDAQTLHVMSHSHCATAFRAKAEGISFTPSAVNGRAASPIQRGPSGLKESNLSFSDNEINALVGHGKAGDTKGNGNNGHGTALRSPSHGSCATPSPFSSVTLADSAKDETWTKFKLLHVALEELSTDSHALRRRGAVRVGLWANLAQKPMRGPFKQLSFADVDLHIDLPKSIGIQRLGTRIVSFPFCHIPRRYRRSSRANVKSRLLVDGNDNYSSQNPSFSNNVPFFLFNDMREENNEATGEHCNRINDTRFSRDIVSLGSRSHVTNSSIEMGAPREDETINMLPRKRMVLLGGVFLLEILELPPGPCHVKSKLRMQRVTSLSKLVKVQHFPPGADIGALVPMSTPMARISPGLNQYLRARIKVPDGVLTSPDLLAVVWWDSTHEQFIDGTTSEVEYDVVKREVAFNAARSGLLAFAHANTVDLPYASWSLTAARPFDNDSPSEMEEACCHLTLATRRFELVIEIRTELEEVRIGVQEDDAQIAPFALTSRIDSAVATSGCRLVAPADVPELSHLVGSCGLLSPGRLIEELRRTGVCVTPGEGDRAALCLSPTMTTALELKLCKEIASLATSFDFESVDGNDEPNGAHQWPASFEANCAAFRVRESTTFLDLEGDETYDFRTFLIEADASSPTSSQDQNNSHRIPTHGKECNLHGRALQQRVRTTPACVVGNLRGIAKVSAETASTPNDSNAQVRYTVTELTSADLAMGVSFTEVGFENYSTGDNTDENVVKFCREDTNTIKNTRSAESAHVLLRGCVQSVCSRSAMDRATKAPESFARDVAELLYLTRPLSFCASSPLQNRSS
mmetsp:Transcript_22711/g.69805  ORF Transcript_22711/g.69805 Transcript_22711/m.69805 type:complete len:951 (+) Transcript_22711:55-2907(+)